MDKFGKNSTPLTSLGLTIAKDYAERQNRAIKQALKSYAYYKNDIDGIEYFLKEYLKRVLNPKTASLIPLVYLNYVPKIVKKLCLVYKNQPTVTLSSGQEQYEKLIGKLNIYRKEFHRQAKLLNTILVRPIWNEKEFTYFILNRGLADIETAPDDRLKMEKLSYRIEDNGNDYTIVWTDADHYAIDEQGKRTTLSGMNDNGSNPYGRIPFVVLRLEECADFWGDGLPDVVNGNEHLNARLTDMIYKAYMSFGVPFGVNLGIKDVSEFVLDPKKAILVEKDNLESVQPSLQFVTPEQNIETDRNLNDWLRTELGISKGLSANSFAQDVLAQSGYAKMMDSIETLDLNEDDREVLRYFEYELFDMMKLTLDSLPNVPKITGELQSFEFGILDFPQNATDIWLDREKEYQYGISTPLDWLRETRPDLSDEELLKVISENVKIKNTTIEVKAAGRIESILSRLNAE